MAREADVAIFEVGTGSPGNPGSSTVGPSGEALNDISASGCNSSRRLHS